MNEIKNLRKLTILLDASGTATALTNTKLYQGSYGFINLQVYVPITQNAVGEPLLTVYRTTVDNMGQRRQYRTDSFNLLYVDKVCLDTAGQCTMHNAQFSMNANPNVGSVGSGKTGGVVGNSSVQYTHMRFECPLPQAFTDVAGDLEMVFNYTESVDKEIVDPTDPDATIIVKSVKYRLTSNIYSTTVLAGGVADSDIQLDLNEQEAEQINANKIQIEILKQLINGILGDLGNLNSTTSYGFRIYKVANNATAPDDILDRPELQDDDTTAQGYVWLGRKSIRPLHTDPIYNMWVWTRKNGTLEEYWQYFGEFPRRGDKGQQGADGLSVKLMQGTYYLPDSLSFKHENTDTAGQFSIHNSQFSMNVDFNGSGVSSPDEQKSLYNGNNKLEQGVKANEQNGEAKKDTIIENCELRIENSDRIATSKLPSRDLSNLKPLPPFSDTQEGEGYIVDTGIVIQGRGRYDLYYHGSFVYDENNPDAIADWGIVKDWGGIKGERGYSDLYYLPRTYNTTTDAPSLVTAITYSLADFNRDPLLGETFNIVTISYDYANNEPNGLVYLLTLRVTRLELDGEDYDPSNPNVSLDDDERARVQVYVEDIGDWVNLRGDRGYTGHSSFVSLSNLVWDIPPENLPENASVGDYGVQVGLNPEETTISIQQVKLSSKNLDNSWHIEPTGQAQNMPIQGAVGKQGEKGDRGLDALVYLPGRIHLSSGSPGQPVETINTMPFLLPDFNATPQISDRFSTIAELSIYPNPSPSIEIYTLEVVRIEGDACYVTQIGSGINIKGDKGNDGKDGLNGKDGANGKDGVSFDTIVKTWSITFPDYSGSLTLSKFGRIVTVHGNVWGSPSPIASMPSLQPLAGTEFEPVYDGIPLTAFAYSASPGGSTPFSPRNQIVVRQAELRLIPHNINGTTDCYYSGTYMSKT